MPQPRRLVDRGRQQEVISVVPRQVYNVGVVRVVPLPPAEGLGLGRPVRVRGARDLRHGRVDAVHAARALELGRHHHGARPGAAADLERAVLSPRRARIRARLATAAAAGRRGAVGAGGGGRILPRDLVGALDHLPNADAAVLARGGKVYARLAPFQAPHRTLVGIELLDLERVAPLRVVLPVHPHLHRIAHLLMPWLDLRVPPPPPRLVIIK
mmetsp:Transcript_14087/g.37042  ORF Transcript_14087/g.37042 Transcript_14087/m.37042 type:complete len:213 (-) Transcript_14087:59-697(-)